MVKLGAQLYTVRDFIKTPEDFDATLRKVADMGYRYVQISGIGEDVPAEFAGAKLKEYGLKCRATHFAFDRIRDNLDEMLKIHDAYGCPYIGTGSMPKEYRENEKMFKQFVEEAGELSERIAKAGKTFIYHNHHFEFAKYGDKIGMDILFDNTPKSFQFELDVFWVQTGGADPMAWIRKVAGRMDVVHYKEMGIDSEIKQCMVPVGQGNMNWEGIIAACNETGVKYAFVEQDHCAKDPFDCLKDSFDYLSKQNMDIE